MGGGGETGYLPEEVVADIVKSFWKSKNLFSKRFLFFFRLIAARRLDRRLASRRKAVSDYGDSPISWAATPARRGVWPHMFAGCGVGGASRR